MVFSSRIHQPAVKKYKFEFNVCCFPIISSCCVPGFASNYPKALMDNASNATSLLKITFHASRKQKKNSSPNPLQSISYLFRQVFLRGGAVFIFLPLSLWPLGVSKHQGQSWMLNTRINQETSFASDRSDLCYFSVWHLQDQWLAGKKH